MLESEFIRFYEMRRALIERALISYARGDRELAHDAVQHGITESLRKFRDREFDEVAQGEFLRYTITCGEHFIDHEWKRRGREPGIDEGYDPPDDFDPDRPMMFAHLERSIRELPESQRRAVQIRYFADEKMTIEEGAKLFGASRETFKRELAQAKKTLRKKMDAEVTV